MREIPLSQGKVALVDDEDYERLTALGNWHAIRGHKTFYAVRNAPSDLTKSGTTTQGMHQVVLGDTQVDHVNGSGLDNRRENLRRADKSQNNMNRGRQSNNTSGHKGVTRDRDKWKAQIGIPSAVLGKKRMLYLGRFDQLEDAAEAYRAAAEKYHGDFARTD
jgi:hypothetical protein